MMITKLNFISIDGSSKTSEVHQTEISNEKSIFLDIINFDLDLLKIYMKW